MLRVLYQLVSFVYVHIISMCAQACSLLCVCVCVCIYECARVHVYKQGLSLNLEITNFKLDWL